MADGTTVDSLQIEIEASSAEAEKRVDALAAALERLKKATTGFGNISDRIRDIGASASESPAAEKTKRRRQALDRATKEINPQSVDLSQTAKDARNIASTISSVSKLEKELEKTEEKVKSIYSSLNNAKGELKQKLEFDPKFQDTEGIAKTRAEIERLYEALGEATVKAQTLEETLNSLKGKIYTGQDLGAAKEEPVSVGTTLESDDSPIEKTKDKLKSLQQAIKALDTGKLQLTNELARAEIQAVKTDGKLGDLRRKLDGLNAAGAGSAAKDALMAAEDSFSRFSNVAEESKKRINDLRDALEELENYTPDPSMQGVDDEIKEQVEWLKSLIQQYHDSNYAVKLAGAEMKNSMSEATAAVKELGSNATAFNPLVNGAKNLANSLKNLTSSGISKAVSGLKSLASSIGSRFTKPFTNAIGVFSKWKSAIGRVAFYRAISLAIRAITEGLKTGMDNLYQYSRLAGTEFAPAMNSLATSALYLKNSLGAMAAPLIQALAPAVDFLIDKFVALINVIGKAFAVLTGKSVYTQAKKHAVEYGEAANKASKATKDFLLGIDELNVINDTAGGGGGAASDFGSMFEEVEIDQDQFDWVKQIREAIENGEWRSVGELVANKLNEVVDSWDSYGWGAKLGGLINNGLNVAYGFLTKFDFENLGLKVADFFNGIFDTVDWDLAGRTFAAGWNGLMEFIYGLITGFHWDTFGKAIADAVIGFFSEIDWELPIKILQAGIEAVRQAFVGFLSEFGERLDIHGITDPLIDIVNTVADTLQKLIEDTKTWLGQLDFTPLITSFENLLAAISPFISVVSEGLLWAYENVLLPLGTWTIEEALPTAINILATGFEFLTVVLEKLSPIAQFLWNDILQPIFSAAWDVLSTAVEAVANTFQKLTDVLGGNTSFSEFLDSLAPGEAIILGVAAALGVLGTAFAIGSAISAAGALISGAITAIGAALAFLTSPIGIVIGSITALVAGFTLLYQNFEPFRNFIDGIVEGAKELVPGIIEGIQEGWTHFTEWLGGLWQSIVDGFKSFFGIHSPSTVFSDLGGYLIEGLLGGISGAWGGIVEFFGGKVEALKEFFSGAWENIKTTASTAWETIKANLGTTWENIKTSAGEKFDAVKEGISAAWESVKTATSEKWESVKSTLSTTWENLKTTAGTTFENIKSTVAEKWEAIKTETGEKWEKVKITLSDAWENMKTTASSKLSEIKTTISDTWGNIVKSAVTWGKDLCSNLAEGIRGGISKVTSAVSSVASKVREFLHFTEPDVGPLSDFHTYMPDMLDLMARGIKENTYKAANAASDLADTMSQALGNIEPVEPKFSNLPSYEMSFSTANIQGREGVSNYAVSPDSGTGGNDNSDLINAFYAAAGMIVEAIQNQDNGVYLDSKQLMQAVEKSQRQRGADIMGGGVL